MLVSYLTPTGKSCTGLRNPFSNFIPVRLFVYPPQLDPFPPVFTSLYSGSVKGLLDSLACAWGGDKTKGIPSRIHSAKEFNSLLGDPHLPNWVHCVRLKCDIVYYRKRTYISLKVLWWWPRRRTKQSNLDFRALFLSRARPSNFQKREKN